MKLALTFMLCMGCVSLARGEVKTKSIEYRDGDVVLEGFVAWDPAAVSQSAPGVLVVHQWMGLTDYEQSRCHQLAELGYVAFALDIYGKGVRPENQQAAGKLAGVYKSDRKLYRKRLNLGLDQLTKTIGSRLDEAGCDRLLLRRHRRPRTGAKRC
jgi:dienelactone hydrolase